MLDTQLAPGNVHYYNYYHTVHPWVYSIINYALKMSCVNILCYQKILIFENKNLDLYLLGTV